MRLTVDLSFVVGFCSEAIRFLAWKKISAPRQGRPYRICLRPLDSISPTPYHRAMSMTEKYLLRVIEQAGDE